MSVTIHSGGTVAYPGDSITAAGWMTVAGGLNDRLNAKVVPAPRVGRCAAGASVGRAAGGASVGRGAAITLPIAAVNSGISGNTTSDIAQAVAARITNYGPSAIVMLIGINDLLTGVPPSTTAANYESILSQIRAWSSTVPIACVSVLWRGEQWVQGPPLAWSNAASGGYDAAIDSLNTTIQGLCLTYNATYIEMRAPALIYESVHNTPAPGEPLGVLSLDDLHPNATGQFQMGVWAIDSFVVLP